MNSSSKKWNQLIDDLHLGGATDYIEVTIPVAYSASNTLSWTDDDGTDGQDVDDYVVCRDGGSSNTICKIPVSMGFSAYTVTTPSASSSSTSSGGGSGGGGGGCALGYTLVDGVCVADTTETVTEEVEDVTEEETVTEEAAPAEEEIEIVSEGEANLAGQAWGQFGEALLDLSWLWVTVVILAIAAFVGVYVYRRKQ